MVLFLPFCKCASVRLMNGFSHTLDAAVGTSKLDRRHFVVCFAGGGTGPLALVVNIDFTLTRKLTKSFHHHRLHG